MGAIHRFFPGAVMMCVFSLAPAAFALDGHILYTEGTVTVTSSGNSHNAELGTRVSTGDAVSTSEDGLAIIDLSNATQIKLRENTTVVIVAIGKDAQISLSAGAVFTRILGKLAGSSSIQAEGTIAGVRGTEFFIAYGPRVNNQRDIWLCVNEGIVDVSVPSTNQHELVPAGEGINVVGGAKLTAPRGYTWTRELNWNMDPASGNVQDHTNLDRVYSELRNHGYH